MQDIRVDAPISENTNEYINEVLKDYWICLVSREASLIARKEVLTGKAKFGITGDGKEVPQVAMARAWQKGDFRSGYYRDQTLMFALGLMSVEDYFAQLYADVENDPFSKGRQMNGHFATPLNQHSGEWLDHTEHFNISADISPTAGQMARALGLAMASKVYKTRSYSNISDRFSREGREVCFCTIGDASTSEGVFWETMNAACVMKVPLAVSVWDDGYGISVPIEYQTTKKSISKAMNGMAINEEGEGMHIYHAKAWDYASLVETYITGIDQMRKDHVPALFHIQEVTQPQGHSTSGSHERYKSKERLELEKERDCIEVMRQWILENELTTDEELNSIKAHAHKYAKEGKNRAWNNYLKGVSQLKNDLLELLREASNDSDVYQGTLSDIEKMVNPSKSDLIEKARIALATTKDDKLTIRSWIHLNKKSAEDDYRSDLYLNSDLAAVNIAPVWPEYTEDTPLKSGFQILNDFFNYHFDQNPRLITFGEDVGKIGDVNQGFAGLQEKYGEDRVFDTGIREWTIIGQAIGLSMRGLRPIAEIQYLDYLIYAMSALSDDLATLRYRSGGQQQAPAIIRTRGHRLEGIWHSGSPMGMILNAVRGMYVLVPRNMTIAAGFYNTMLKSAEPSLIVECLNGYRLKEKVPNNLVDITIPVGTIELLASGDDITVVSYGSTLRVVQEAVEFVRAHDGITVDLVDVMSLLPFDTNHDIAKSVKKTSRILIVDEDAPGGASAFILDRLMNEQGIYNFLDAKPVCLTAAANRPPYGSDGDYYCKPSMIDIVEQIREIVIE